MYVCIYIYIYNYIHTHIHFLIYIYICIFIDELSFEFTTYQHFDVVCFGLKWLEIAT